MAFSRPAGSQANSSPPAPPSLSSTAPPPLPGKRQPPADPPAWLVNPTPPHLSSTDARQPMAPYRPADRTWSFGDLRPIGPVASIGVGLLLMSIVLSLSKPVAPQSTGASLPLDARTVGFVALDSNELVAPSVDPVRSGSATRGATRKAIASRTTALSRMTDDTVDHQDQMPQEQDVPTCDQSVGVPAVAPVTDGPSDGIEPQVSLEDQGGVEDWGALVSATDSADMGQVSPFDTSLLNPFGDGGPDACTIDRPPIEDQLGTAIQWAQSVEEAAATADEEGRLLFILHVSGNFEIEGFT